MARNPSSTTNTAIATCARTRKNLKSRNNGGRRKKRSIVVPLADKVKVSSERDLEPKTLDVANQGRNSNLSEQSSTALLHNADSRLEQNDLLLRGMEDAARTILACVGEDPNREGLLATPTRFAKALLFLTKGYQVDINALVNNALFHEDHHEMVIVKDIEIHSLCEHHLVPFTGKMHIGYIPANTVIGLSKLPRIAEMFSRRLQIQERLTKQVAHAIMDIVKPQGVAVVMQSCHLCMAMRGVEKSGTATITSCVLGCFEEDKTRNEFLSLVGVNRV